MRLAIASLRRRSTADGAGCIGAALAELGAAGPGEGPMLA
eukprot:CAMPEP_0204357078 /NCGR_PEP_ID=MMETSP0469-20131031/35460_1 /ASSEMBLY_ACC=CAM_ASM_000384 /TAXON_ID=2969 /ORGANISM="Oxyrrhis marina" /LENGTH=39 /DNA_ID= /DNA_START= /DNA_END= /DNA_ORIENTATION=